MEASIPLCSADDGSGGLVATDQLGNPVKASKWLASHKPDDRSLAQGLKVRHGAGTHWKWNVGPHMCASVMQDA